MSAPRVLIVDDSAINLALAQIVLQGEHFEVETAADGLQAIAQAALFQPDLILMDIQMPGMDGLEVTRVLKSDPATRHIRIAAFTAFAMREDEARMRAAGCDAYLAKPIDARTFGEQVRTCLTAPSWAERLALWRTRPTRQSGVWHRTSLSRSLNQHVYFLQVWISAIGWVHVDACWDWDLGWHYQSTARPTTFTCYERARRLADAIADNCDVSVGIGKRRKERQIERQ